MLKTASTNFTILPAIFLTRFSCNYQAMYVKTILTVCLVLAGLSVPAQRNYYFSSHAGDDGDGSRLHPFSPSDLGNLSLQKGDTVFFAGGDTFRVQQVFKNIAGDKKQPVVFTTWGKGRALLDGGVAEALIFQNSRYFKIMHLSFLGAGRKTGNRTDGLTLTGCDYFSLTHLDIAGFQKAGLLLFNCRFVTVDSVNAHDNGAVGILVEGDYKKRLSADIHITNCRADNNPGDPTNLENHSGNGILVGNCKNIMIEYCSATNNGWDMPRIGNGPVGIWAYEADSVIIQHCISYRNKTATGAADGGGFDLDGGVTNSIIQYCLSYENQGTGYGIYQYYSASRWNNNIVRYCVSINDGKITENASGMYIWNGWNGDSTFTNFYAYQNFFYNDEKYAFSFSPLSQHKQFYFFNNIFVAADTSDIYYGTDSSASDIFAGNVWMRKSGGFRQHGFSDFKEWSGKTGYEQLNKQTAGHTFNHPLFFLPSSITMTDPHELAGSELLRSLCNLQLQNKGIHPDKIRRSLLAKQDFFGHAPVLGKKPEPGICEIK